MMTSPFTLMKGDYFPGLTRSRIIRWLRVQGPVACSSLVLYEYVGYYSYAYPHYIRRHI